MFGRFSVHSGHREILHWTSGGGIIKSDAMIDPLYQKEILRLAAEASGAGQLAHADISLTVKNPMCGDQIRLDLQIADGAVKAMAHETRACVLCQASASLLARTAPGQTEPALQETRDLLVAMLTGAEASEKLADFAVFSPVRDHPNRHKCVTLPLDAVLDAFGQFSQTAKT